MKFIKLILPIYAFIFYGCEDSAVNCTTEFVSGLEVTVIDVATGNSIIEGKPIGIAQDGNYIDTMGISSRSVDLKEFRYLYGAGERIGRYSVRIELEGYETWSKENIIVTRDECHVITQKITAFLKKK